MIDRLSRILGLIVKLLTVLAILGILLTTKLRWDNQELQRKYSNSKVCTLLSGNLERTYRVHAPARFEKNAPLPLLFALHGGGGNSAHMEVLTFGGFNDLADKETFLVVYPEGIDRVWNDGRGIQNYRAQRENIDDVDFFSAMIETLKKEYPIDPKRIYATGISNGGFMINRLAGDLPHTFAAIAPVSTSMSEKIFPSYRPANPISVLLIQGTEDPLVPWGGGEVGLPYRKFSRGIAFPEIEKFWVGFNHCASAPLVEPVPGTIDDGMSVERRTYGGGKDGSEVVVLEIKGGGHTWPSGQQYFPEFLVGKTSRNVHACRSIWDFCKKHSLPWKAHSENSHAK